MFRKLPVTRFIGPNGPRRLDPQINHFHSTGRLLQQAEHVQKAKQSSGIGRAAAPFIGGAITGGGLYFYFQSISKENKESKIIDISDDYRYKQLKPTEGPVFEFGYNAGPWGEGNYQTFVNVLQPMEKIEAALHANEKSFAVDRPGNPVVKIETNFIPTNTPIEDRHSIDIIATRELGSLVSANDSRSFWEKWYDLRTMICPNWKNDLDGKIKAGDGSDDLVLISVIDGHGAPGLGGKVSDLLKQTMHGCLAWAFAEEASKLEGKHCNAGGLDQILQKSFAMQLPVEAGEFTRIMKETNYTDHVQFLDMGCSIIQAPLHLVNNKVTIPPPHPYTNMPPPALGALTFYSGACAITAAIDVANDKLYIAHVGDTRGVAGWYDHKSGMWRCDTLTADHGCENPAEAKRIQDAHPGEEWAVKDEGWLPRIRANYEPSRVFGDDSVKLTDDEIDRYRHATDIVKHHWDLGPNLTPPYAICEPELTVRKIHPESGEELKFLLLATDGLFDQLSSEEVALNLAAYLNQRASGKLVSKVDLPKLVPFKAANAPRPFPAEDLPGTGSKANGIWAFEDANAATHLARNSFGGGEKDKLQMVMSMKDGARKVRDDWTAVVVFFDDAGLSTMKV